MVVITGSVELKPIFLHGFQVIEGITELVLTEIPVGPERINKRAELIA